MFLFLLLSLLSSDPDLISLDGFYERSFLCVIVWSEKVHVDLSDNAGPCMLFLLSGLFSVDGVEVSKPVVFI